MPPEVPHERLNRVDREADGPTDVHGLLTHAAVALFGRREALAGGYPQLTLRLARFRGTSKATTELADNRQQPLAAFDLLELQGLIPSGRRLGEPAFVQVKRPVPGVTSGSGG